MRTIFTVGLLTALSLSYPAFAAETDISEPSLNQAEALAFDAKIYAETYGTSFEEAARRLLIMHDTQNEMQSSAFELGDTLAGAYFDNGEDFGLEIRTTAEVAPVEKFVVRQAKRDTKKAVKKEQRVAERQARRAERKALRQKAKLTDNQVETAEDLIETDIPVKVKYRSKAKNSLKELKRAVNDNYTVMQSTVAGFQMAFPDEETGEVVIYLSEVASSATSTSLQALFPAPVRIEIVPTGIQPVHSRGGAHLEIGGAHTCMTGFTVKRNSNNDLGIVTAGHCNDPSYTYRAPDGSYTMSDVPGMTVDNATMDLRFMKANHVALGEFYADSTSTARKVTATRSRASTTAAAGTTKGSFICHLGQFSNTNSDFIQSCGEVISTAGSNSVRGASGNFVVVRNTQSGAGTTRTSGQGTLRCFRGDSGGPWFALTTAYGVMSACAWVDTAETITDIAIYTSVDYFSNLGVTIVK